MPFSKNKTASIFSENRTSGEISQLVTKGLDFQEPKCETIGLTLEEPTYSGIGHDASNSNSNLAKET